MLNRCLSEAIFANKVLLVEGPSEYMLFSKVLSVVHPFYEVDGIYILPVDGVGFETYFSILDELEIFNVVKTDNDLRAVTGKGTFSWSLTIATNVAHSSTIPENMVLYTFRLYAIYY